jgi:hypothetical protein
MPEDKELLASVKLAKTRPMYFAFVAKGNDGKLLMDKKKIPPKVADDAKKACGGGTIYVGRAKSEEGVMVFETGKEAPAGIAALTKKILKRDTALNLEVEYRVATDVEGEDVGDSGAPTGADVPPAPPAPPAPTAAPDIAARVASRLKTLVPAVKKVEALGSPLAAQAKAQIAEASKLFLAKQFEPASAGLDRGEALLKQALLEAKSATKAPASPVLPLWVAAKDEVGGQMSALQDAMRGTRHRLLARIADQGLNALTKRLQVGLQVALMEVDSAAPEARPARAQAARGRIAEFRTFLQSDPSIPLLDQNPLGVPVTIRTRLTAALDEIETALGR